MASPRKTKKVRRNIPEGKAFIKATFNNTIITLSDVNGNVVAWSSAGSKGFKGSRKSTPFAGQMAAEDAGKQARDMGMHSLQVFIKGPGPGRDAALRALQNVGFKISYIKDVTPIPHNGCRPPKQRRV